jgi:predicted DNA-binding protein (MmcQ/YjbR family)
MILIKEITKWDVEYRQPNHTYLADDKMNKIYGYFKWHNPKDFMMFKNPTRLDKRYRQFKTIKTGLKMKGEQ